MEVITIKRSTQPYRSLVWLFVTLIPVVLFSYAMFSTRGNDAIVFGLIAMVFLLPAIVDFVANKLIRLKAAVLISEHGLILSPSKGLYDSFAFLQIFQSKRETLIKWEHITGFKLSVDYQYLTSYPNEGEVTASTTYSVARHLLCVENISRNGDVIFSVDDLGRSPDEILVLCNQYLKKYGTDLCEGIKPI